MRQPQTAREAKLHRGQGVEPRLEGSLQNMSSPLGFMLIPDTTTMPRYVLGVAKDVLWHAGDTG